MAKTRNWVIIMLILLSIYLMSAIFANFLSVVQPEVATSGNVAVIPIKGAITSDGSDDFFGSSGASASNIIKLIEKAEKDDKIKAVIFEINSPGGYAVASQEIMRKVREMNKTSVAWIREVGASGAYWVASATDHIIASDISVTGSIGVLSSYLEFSGLLERFNITYERLVSGEYKDVQSPFRSLDEKERNHILERLEKVHSVFKESVAENRNLTDEVIEELSEGQIFLGLEAVENGLIDELGNLDEAIKFVEEKHNITADLSRFEGRKSLLEILSEISARHGFSIGQGLQSEATQTARPFRI